MQQAEEKIEVEVEEEQPKEEVQQELDLAPAEEKTEEPAEQEASEDPDSLEGYSEKVKKRIEKLTYKMREAERREQAATEYARSLQQQNEKLQQRSEKIDESYITEYGNRITSQEANLKKQLADAINNGDVDAQVEAQNQIAQLAADQRNYNTVKQERETKTEPVAEQQQPQPKQPVDPKAQAWASRNAWFGSDEPMTLTAFSHHKQMVEKEYYDPTSDDYYKELDARMKRDFPHKFGGTVQSNHAPVASVSRPNGKATSKKIKLSPSQVAIADKLGVPYDAYAKQLARLNNS